jgi:hypothetical protein
MCTFDKCCEQSPCVDCTKVNNTPVKVPHKHAALIKAWAYGAKIQYHAPWGWKDIQCPDWMVEGEYRIKPEPKPDVVMWGRIEKTSSGMWAEVTNIIGKRKDKKDNIEFVFDGESGELKSVEKI